MRMRWTVLLILLTTAIFAQNPRPRAREAKVVVGVLPPGPLNAITDVNGLLVGQTTVVRAPDVHTGVTAILPHSGNLFREKVPGAVFVGNAFGKLAGSTQVEELGEIETPILLTSTLNVPRVADAVIDYMLALPGNETVQSINPLVGETNDGGLNDIRSRPVGRDDVFNAIKTAKSGAVEEGAVGAGTGTIAFSWKGGIGTSSRKLPASLGGYTVGVLVQTNFGGILTINGAPVGQELGQYYLKAQLPNCRSAEFPNCENLPSAAKADSVSGAGGTAKAVPFPKNSPAVTPEAVPFPNNSASVKVNGQRPRTNDPSPDGSCMIVVATDGPVDARNLKRLAARAIMGLARTGSSGSNGSGDYVIAFSTAQELRIRSTGESPVPHGVVSNEGMSPLFEAVIEATEEAIYNSMFKATTTTGRGRTIEALPIDKTLEILREHKLLKTP
jgi:D-aminopeptidase